MTTSTRTDVSLVAHLMRRAAFGLPAWRLEQLAEQPYEELVEDLLHVERYERPVEDLMDRFNLEHANEEDHWFTLKKWFYRMINTERPLEDKVALMWHNRFATAASKVTNPLMLRHHLEMLQDGGMGNFNVILSDLSHDPGMIYWLDQQTNHDGAINENYGRELLELFSMGRGNYTEDDVQASANAFTGWTIEQTIPRYPNGWYESRYVFRDDDHDFDTKTFLGEKGAFNGDEIVDIVVRQPATGQFVAATLYKFFVADEPDQNSIDSLAQVYFDSGYEISEMLRVLLNSDYFKNARFARVRSPAELIVNTTILNGQHRDPYEFGIRFLLDASRAMGQELLNPPTVEGWHTGREWIDSAFLIERVNFAVERLSDAKKPGVRRIIDHIGGMQSSFTATELLDACLYGMGCWELEDKSRWIILEDVGELTVTPGSDAFDEAVTRMFGYIASSREFQMA
jgi:uncharacterized protein (DUF1800 family)